MRHVRPLEVVSAPYFRADTGVLRVLDAALMPFDVVRLFFVEAPHGSIRGQHAHVRGQQFFIVVSGSIEVRVEDPDRTQHTFGLETGDCLLVPPLHWASEHFEGTTSVLLVLCDSPYTEDDYIRDYHVFDSRLTQSR